MKPRRSPSLNPNARSYIPCTNDSTGGPNLRNPPSDNLSPSLNRQHGRNAPVTIASPVKNSPVRGSVSQRSYALSEVEKFDKQFKLDLKHLHANFSKLSKEFLTEVYLENKADLNAAVDTLKQLESKHAPDYAQDYEGLPDSLGIGDTTESGSAAAGRPSSEKNVAKGSSSTSSRFR